MTDQRAWMTMQEAADHIGVSYQRFTAAAKRGALPVSKVPGFKRKYRVSRTKLDEVMRENEASTADRI